MFNPVVVMVLVPHWSLALCLICVKCAKYVNGAVEKLKFNQRSLKETLVFPQFFHCCYKRADKTNLFVFPLTVDIKS